MSSVFGHGRLRLYLLKLLDDSPRHGYEIIRLLQDRFLGVYAPSAGTVYPRLARLEEEGLVTHDEEEGGRKVYRLTDAGRDELRRRVEELDDLEAEIADSVPDLAREVKEDVRDSMRTLREELKDAARDVRHNFRRPGGLRDDDGWGEVWASAQSLRDQAWREARQSRREAHEGRREAREAWGERKRHRRPGREAHESARRETRDARREAPESARRETRGAAGREPHQARRRPDRGQGSQAGRHSRDRHELRRIMRRFNEDVHDALDVTVVDDDLLRDIRIVLDEALRTLGEIVDERRQRDDPGD
jgi:DNA-binding PadR family transcriptional regulator